MTCSRSSSRPWDQAPPPILQCLSQRALSLQSLFWSPQQEVPPGRPRCPHRGRLSPSCPALQVNVLGMCPTPHLVVNPSQLRLSFHTGPSMVWAGSRQPASAPPAVAWPLSLLSIIRTPSRCPEEANEGCSWWGTWREGSSSPGSWRPQASLQAQEAWEGIGTGYKCILASPKPAVWLSPPGASVSSLVKWGGWLGRVPQEPRKVPVGMSKAEVFYSSRKLLGFPDGKLPAGFHLRIH